LAIFILAGCKGSKDAKATASSSKKTKSESVEFQNWFFEAQTSKQVEDYDRAYAGFVKCTEIAPKNSSSYYEMSRIDFVASRTEQGLVNIEKAIELDGSNFWYRKTYASYLMELGRFADSQKQWEMLVKQDPNDIEAYYNLAACFLYQEKGADAIKAYDALENKIGVTPEISYQKERIFLLSNNFEGALGEIDKLIEAYPGEMEFIVQKAELLVELNRASEAQKLLEDIIADEPNNGMVQLQLSRLYAAQNKDSQSFDALVKAFEAPEVAIDEKIGILLRYFSVSEFDARAAENSAILLKIMDRVHPEDPKTHSIYGDYLVRDNKLAEAEERFLRAVELDPARPLLWSQVLSLELELGKWKALLENSKRARELYPTQPDFYLMEGFAYMRSDKPEEAIKTLSLGKSFVVDNPLLLSRFLSTLGEAYNETKEFEKSDQSFEKAIEKDGNDPYVLNNYAYYLALRGEKLNRAEELSKKSLEIMPGSGSFMDTYGWVLFKLGRYAEAKEYTEKALTAGLPDAVVLEHLGDIIYHLGDVDQAVQYWEEALKSGGTGKLTQKIADKKYYAE
jgi:predicted Zn-dependent protease